MGVDTVLQMDLDDLKRHFQRRIHASSLSIKFSEHAKKYIEDLLFGSVRADALFADVGRGEPVRTKALAAIKQKADSTVSPQLKREIWNRAGDLCLLLAGYFPQSLSPLIYNEAEYISIGQGAYHHTALLSRRQEQAYLFNELERKFKRGVALVAEVLTHGELPLDEVARAYIRKYGINTIINPKENKPA